MHPGLHPLGASTAGRQKTLLVGGPTEGASTSLTIRVHVAGHLRDYTGRSVELEIPGARDVLEVVAQLNERVPNIKDRIFDEHDRTRPFINIYVNEEDIRGLDAERTKTKDGDVIYILPSVAGGKGSLSSGAGWGN